MKKNLKMPDFYKTMSKRELTLYSLEGEAIVLIFSYFFYKSYMGVVVLLPLVVAFLYIKAKEVKKKKQWKMLLCFKEMMNSTNSSIQAGLSINNAFLVAYDDMCEMFGNESEIAAEIKMINAGVKNNIPLESLIYNMSIRNEIKEMENFADLVATFKRTGGNVVDIIQTYVNIIEEKVSLKQEIETMISAKKYEQRIMNIIPFVILFYVDITNKGYFDVLYHNLVGTIIMTLVMSMYIASVFWSNHIIENII